MRDLLYSEGGLARKKLPPMGEHMEHYTTEEHDELDDLIATEKYLND